MAAEGRAQLEELVSVAAGIMLGADGQGDHGPARAQTAHGQRAQAGTDARVWSGARVKKETSHHRRAPSFRWLQSCAGQFYAMALDPR